MGQRLMSVVLAALPLLGELDLDCSRPASSKRLIGQARLSEIEWAEDVNRFDMWEAFGRCAGRPEADACREEARQSFGQILARQRADIEARYRDILRDFETRCQTTLTRGPVSRARPPL